MTAEKICFVLAGSAFAYFVLSEIYDMQFSNQEFEYDPDWIGDLCPLREVKDE